MDTEVIKISNEENAADRAGKMLRNGKLVAFPTDTVYGIGVDVSNASAVKRLYEIKGRDERKPLVIQVHSPEMILPLREVKEFAPEERALMERFWPGPLTIVFGCAGDRKTLAVRIPGNGITLDILKAAGIPLGVPSANISGRKPPVSAEEVLEDLNGLIDAVMDGGKTEHLKESTIVDLSKNSPLIIREGAVSTDEIERCLRGETYGD